MNADNTALLDEFCDAVWLEDGLAKGPYVVETFPVHVEDSYVIIET